MTNRMITPPALPAVTLADARLAARIDGTALDSELTTQVRAFTEEVEHELGRALISQTWTVTLDAFPDAIELPMPPVQSVTSIKFFDLDGAQQTLDPADYYSDLVTEPCYIVPAAGKAWPPTLDRVNAVTVEVVCGYGPTADDTPSGIRQYILARLVEEQAGAPGSPFLCRLLDRYRVYG